MTVQHTKSRKGTHGCKKGVQTRIEEKGMSCDGCSSAGKGIVTPRPSLQHSLTKREMDSRGRPWLFCKSPATLALGPSPRSAMLDIKEEVSTHCSHGKRKSNSSCIRMSLGRCNSKRRQESKPSRAQIPYGCDHFAASYRWKTALYRWDVLITCYIPAE